MGSERLRYTLLRHAFRNPLGAVDVAVSLIDKKPRTRIVSIGHGLKMEVVLPDHISICARMGIAYEPDVTAFMQQVIKPGNIVFDIGAHFGYQTLMSSMMVGDSGKVISFEPTPSTYQILKRNTEQRPNIITRNLALSDGQNDTVELQDFGFAYCGLNTITQAPRITPSLFQGRLGKPVVTTVDATSVDQYLLFHPDEKPDVIKLDAENAEMSILKGAQQTIASHTPSIIMECGDQGRTKENSTQSCIDYLGARGYVFYRYDFGSKTVQECLLPSSQIAGHNILGVHLSKVPLYSSLYQIPD